MDKKKARVDKPNKIAAIITVVFTVGIGIAFIPMFVDALKPSWEKNALSVVITGLGTIVGLSLILWQRKRLMQVGVIKKAVDFFKKTQWLWFFLIITAIIVLWVVNPAGNK